ncbi:hypothetical protein KQX54_019634 [Cotesia glomerata]|uniref:Uncharacterized protein n=1 Tax=Cotesia glomerata TaxID=32391 RepID=A0AAV7J1W8_COTGL|nr:hypothetical protein KQX54_019634 [Cotesia glomerata]
MVMILVLVTFTIQLIRISHVKIREPGVKTTESELQYKPTVEESARPPEGVVGNLGARYQSPQSLQSPTFDTRATGRTGRSPIKNPQDLLRQKRNRRLLKPDP